MSEAYSRRPRDVRAATVNMNRFPKKALAKGRALYPRSEDAERPKTRAECAGAPRPCPYVSCKHHLYLDVSKRGSIKVNFPDIEVEAMTESCALDVAEAGERTREEVGALMNMTGERVRQLEESGLEKLRESALELDQ